MPASVCSLGAAVQHVEYAPDRIPRFRTRFHLFEMYAKARVPRIQYPFRCIGAHHAFPDLWLTFFSFAGMRQLKLYIIGITIEQTDPAPCRIRVRHFPKYGS